MKIRETQWFDPVDQKPWEPGVYERFGFCGSGTVFTYWNGEHFGYLGSTPDEAVEQYTKSNGRKSCHQKYIWRGVIYE